MTVVGIEDPFVFTPYSTVKPLLGYEDMALWAPELDRDRVMAYEKYEEIYWNHPYAFRLLDFTNYADRPVFVPNPRTIVDTTAHFYMKGLQVLGVGDVRNPLNEFLDREEFLPKFHIAKHSGVTRGDYVLHLTADPSKPEGTRLSVNSVDPASYFPEFDEDDLCRVLAVNLVEQVIQEDQPTDVVIHRLRYSYEFVGAQRRVVVQEATYEVRDWWKGTRVKVKDIKPPAYLPAPITQIPVYHFKNMDWQGQPFGSSELKGYEAMQARINQSATDEDVSLALEGLGVYMTDAPQPVNADGQAEDWSIAPGRVLEVPAGSIFKRVEGVNSVKPFQDHLTFLVDSLYEASGTFRGGMIDAQVAQSGIALAIKFLPTQAKLEERDLMGVSKLTQFFFDWKAWNAAYESRLLTGNIQVIIGDKLPQNKTDVLNVLNNALDRGTISKQFYREQIAELYGLEIPSNMQDQILAEKQAEIELQQQVFAAQQPPPDGNQSNNRKAPNESKGSEAQQTPAQQTRP